MKKLSIFFCALCVCMIVCFPVFADMINPFPGGVVVPDLSGREILGIVVSAVLAAVTAFWYWLTHKK